MHYYFLYTLSHGRAIIGRKTGCDRRYCDCNRRCNYTVLNLLTAQFANLNETKYDSSVFSGSLNHVLEVWDTMDLGCELIR